MCSSMMWSILVYQFSNHPLIFDMVFFCFFLKIVDAGLAERNRNFYCIAWEYQLARRRKKILHPCKLSDWHIMIYLHCNIFLLCLTQYLYIIWLIIHTIICIFNGMWRFVESSYENVGIKNDLQERLIWQDHLDQLFFRSYPQLLSMRPAPVVWTTIK